MAEITMREIMVKMCIWGGHAASGAAPAPRSSQGHRPGPDMSTWSSAHFPQLLEGDALRITDAVLLGQGWLKEGDLFGTLLGWEKAGEGAIARTPVMASRQKH